METTNNRAESAIPVLSPAQQTHRNEAVTAMVLGITSIVLVFLPVLNIIALIVGIIGLVKARKNRAFAAANDLKEDSMNSAGYVCSICGIVLAAISVIVFALFLILGLVIVSSAATALPQIMPEIREMLPAIGDMLGEITTALPVAML